MFLKIHRRIAQFRMMQRKIGFWNTVKYALNLIYRKSTLASIEHYHFIYENPFTPKLQLPTNTKNHVINWVIPDFNIGSGGHLNIFRVVKKLEEKGFICRINIDGITHFSSAEQARNCIRQHFFPIDAEVSLGQENLLPAIATFATSWTTAYTVRDFKDAGKRYYFVQDFEPYFYALGSEYAFAEATYRFGFKGITAGSWLAEKLASEFAMETKSYGFSYDSHLYKPYPRQQSERKKVFFYARPVTPRRAFELGILTLALVHASDPSIEFVLAGWDTSSYSIPFPHINAGIVALEQLPNLYSQCDVALVLSLTNLSLLPLEVMACNCAVVSNRGKNVEWLLNKEVVKFADMTPEALSQAILELCKNHEKLIEMKETGRLFANTTNWDVEIEKIINEIIKDCGK